MFFRLTFKKLSAWIAPRSIMEDFITQLASYKKAIDADIQAYSSHIRNTTRKQYGEHSGAVTDAYLNILGSGGKRIRGALAMVGYEMCGGKDRDMIVRAATALEMIHAYILIIDDIQDRSKVRRGQSTVHEALAAYHRGLNLKGDSAHVGVSLALNAALTGAHAAQMLFAGLSVDEEFRTKVIGIVNHTMVITAHGQTSDIINESLDFVKTEDVEHTLEWKTAHYTILNPLCVGMVLAGAGCEDTDAIRDYALHTGMAFQITDDIMGIFGDDSKTGKSIMDDVREGKQTLLTLYALDHAEPNDQKFLRGVLGKDSLTSAEFQKAKQIIEKSGALTYARDVARNHVRDALQSLDAVAGRWRSENVGFLRSLSSALLDRAA